MDNEEFQTIAQDRIVRVIDKDKKEHTFITKYSLAYSKAARLAGFKAVYGRNPADDAELFDNTPIYINPPTLQVDL